MSGTDYLGENPHLRLAIIKKIKFVQDYHHSFHLITVVTRGRPPKIYDLEGTI